MKKFLMFLCTLSLFFGLAGTASAISYTDTKILDLIIGEGPLAQLLYGETYSYSHNTPVDFEVPWDNVNSAYLSLVGYWIDGNNDKVEVNGTTIGTLTPGGAKGLKWSWSTWTFECYDNPSISLFDITSTFSEWTNGSPLDITISADGKLFDGILEISTSTFNLNYDNSSPIPEPATMLLLAAGLFGFVGYKRLRKN